MFQQPCNSYRASCLIVVMDRTFQHKSNQTFNIKRNLHNLLLPSPNRVKCIRTVCDQYSNNAAAPFPPSTQNWQRCIQLITSESVTLNHQNTPDPSVKAFFLPITGQSVALRRFSMHADCTIPTYSHFWYQYFLKGNVQQIT